MKPEDRKRLKQHIEMIVEHKEPEAIVRENFKQLQDEVTDLREKNIKLRLELHTLRFKESQENRFVWWIYQVYAKNVTDFCVAVKTRIPVNYQFGRIDELYKRIKKYTEHIYDGTYLDVEMSTEQSNSDVSMTQDVLTDIKTGQSIENTNPDYYKDELYLDEDFRMLAKTYPADVSAIGVTTLIDYVEAVEAELARRDEIIARLKETLPTLKISHNYCEDCWYSCPKAEGGCCNDAEGEHCNCGADKHNAIIDALMKEFE